MGLRLTWAATKTSAATIMRVVAVDMNEKPPP